MECEKYSSLCKILHIYMLRDRFTLKNRSELSHHFVTFCILNGVIGMFLIFVRSLLCDTGVTLAGICNNIQKSSCEFSL